MLQAWSNKIAFMQKVTRIRGSRSQKATLFIEYRWYASLQKIKIHGAINWALNLLACCFTTFLVTQFIFLSQELSILLLSNSPVA
jgi:hypothetical protein